MNGAHDLRRKIFSHAMTVAALVCVGIALVPLGSILYECVARGIVAISPSFFTEIGPLPCSPQPGVSCSYGGISNAIVGTFVLVGLASLIAVPVGMLAGVYLSEYGNNRIGRTIRFLVDVMVGVPSIVVGIFVFTLFIFFASQGLLPRTYVTSAFSGGIALAIIMLPVVTRTTDEALRLVPTATREAALALGIPKYRTTLRIVLSSARATVITGVLLGVARAGGETAPLIMTASGNLYAFQGLDQRTAALPLVIYNDGLSNYANWIADAWGAALVLVVIMLLISIAARLALTRGMRGAGPG